MVDVYRVTALWNGFQGAPGYSRFSFAGANAQAAVDGAGADLRTFFLALAPYLFTTWTITFPNLIEVHDSITGILTNQMTYTAQPSPVVGSAVTSTAYAGGVGAFIGWKTNTVWQGHRIQGRTFLVPLVGVASADGTLAGTFITAATNAGTALCGSTSSDLCIWSRQFATPPASGQVNGFLASAISAVVPDKTGVLRSRRD